MLPASSKGSESRVARSISTWAGLVNYRGGSGVKPNSSLIQRGIEQIVLRAAAVQCHPAVLLSAASSKRM